MPSFAIATCKATFTDNTGALIDPTIVTAMITPPDKTAILKTYAGATITRTSIGLFTFDQACAQKGTWEVVWHGETANLEKTQKTQFEV